MTEMKSRPADWAQMTPEQKRTWRFQCWADTENQIPFVSDAARENYKVKIKRFIDVYQLREPDQVPVSVRTGVLPFYAGSIDYHTAIHDYKKAVKACIRFNMEHAAELDSFAIPEVIQARALEILDYRLYAWPGHGIDKSHFGFQFVEGEYMKADEYDAFLRDPSGFWMRIYFPRIFGAFEPFRNFSPITENFEIVTLDLAPLALPEVQASLQKMIAAGKELAHNMKIIGKYAGQAAINGFVSPPRGGFAKAPFDTLGDTLRGTAGIMKDMYRQPVKLLAALDLVADLTINTRLNSPGLAESLMVTFPLHKGADGWMSPKQFDTFYWPSLKKVIDALVNEGIIVTLFAEGSYNTRLERVNEFPRGAIHWMLDQTDMAQAKKILGQTCSISGNVPSSLIMTGTPAEVKEHCRKLIEICAPGGGYILGCGAIPDMPRIENLKAMVEAAREYGIYRK